ncbi:helix-turn-helix domain-containing protein [Hydrogenophaga sp. OTU3427]|uniref:helix-turn-helix domain-containing protein n=1 Tax=Hydrogenophaga sp. OTU3427 TaxID=3043856 RepID=UPI00313EFD4B
MRTLAEFSAALTKAQKSHKLTAKTLALRTGLTDQAVRHILAGESAPRLTNAMALADELGFELVLLPKDAAQSLAQDTKAPRTVLSDVERHLGLRLGDPGHDVTKRSRA